MCCFFLDPGAVVGLSYLVLDSNISGVLEDIHISYLRAAGSSYMKNLVYVPTPFQYIKYPLEAATGSTNSKYILQILST